MFDDLTSHAIDDNTAWWPLLRLRPPREENISSDLCLKMAAVQVVLVTAAVSLLTLMESSAARMRFVTSLPMFAVVLFATLYALMRFGMARAWNRRASRLRGD